MPWSMDFFGFRADGICAPLTDVKYLAEIFSMLSLSEQALCRLVVDGVDLKREVRAFGGCLGMYRR